MNSYLARRDSQWMGHLYTYLGLTVGCLDDTEPGTPDRRAAYECDITYGTNNEFGFDYLRDNMVVSLDQRVQRAHIFAIVDEVDSVLIDEARTPLIISGPVGNESRRRLRRAQRRRRAPRAQADRARERPRRAGREGARRGDEQAAGMALYQARLGAPVNKRLLKALQEQGVKMLVQKMELDHIADRKLTASKQAFRDIEEELLYVLDEKGHSVHLTDRGVDFMAPDDHEAFVLPDIAVEIGRIEKDPGHDRRGEAARAPEDRDASTRSRARSSTSCTSC